MKYFALIVVYAIALTAMAFAEMPMPPAISTYYGCHSITIHWPPADSAQFHPTGYRVWMHADGWEEWVPRSQVVDDTMFVDTTLYIGSHFNYGVSAVYDTAESPYRRSDTLFLPNPANYDYFLIGDESSANLNAWYQSILDSLGIRGVIINDILPYSGDWLESLRLLWIVKFGDTAWIFNTSAKDTALVNYLDTGGRVYAHDGEQIYQIFGGPFHSYLPYEYTLCVGWPFLSIHGVNQTFAGGLWYQFPDSLSPSYMMPDGGPAYDVLEDDVQCSCVDLAIDRQGYKVVVNSQPLHLAIDNDSTGTRLEYFRRVLVFFDILSNIKEKPAKPLPDKLTLSSYPNPFNAEVRISFNSARPDAQISLNIFDITGRLIKNLSAKSGDGGIIWDGKNNSGISVSSGLYFACATDGEHTKSIKLTLLR